MEDCVIRSIQVEGQRIALAFRRKTNDRRIIKEVIFDDMYRTKLISTNENVKVLDLGSHIGTFIIRSKLSFPNSIIIGYELDKINYNISRKNIELNSLSNVYISNAAVLPDDIDEVSVFKNDGHYNQGSHSLVYNWKGDNLMDFVRFSDLLKKDRYYLIKMDLEGNEFPILEHVSLQDVAEKTEYLAIELHGDFKQKLRYEPIKFQSIDMILNDLTKYFNILYKAGNQFLTTCLLRSKVD